MLCLLCVMLMSPSSHSILTPAFSHSHIFFPAVNSHIFDSDMQLGPPTHKQKNGSAWYSGKQLSTLTPNQVRQGCDFCKLGAQKLIPVPVACNIIGNFLYCVGQNSAI